MRGFRHLMFPLWFTLLAGSFVFLDMGPSILFLVFPFFFGVLWFNYDWQGFIIWHTQTRRKWRKTSTIQILPPSYSQESTSSAY
jgi:hypothetical protein